VPEHPLSSAAIVGLLAAPARLRVVAALALGASTVAELVTLSGLPDDEVSTAVLRLIRGGLVHADSGRFELDTSAFSTAARAEAPKRPAATFGTDDPAITKVLRSFIVEGALTAIPAPGRKRTIVLEYLAGAFEPGVHYSEPQVNAILRSWHDDVAALRRYLVEEGLLSRDQGEYWRSGGWVDVL
jgi:hypothetical protein